MPASVPGANWSPELVRFFETRRGPEPRLQAEAYHFAAIRRKSDLVNDGAVRLERDCLAPARDSPEFDLAVKCASSQSPAVGGESKRAHPTRVAAQSERMSSGQLIKIHSGVVTARGDPFAIRRKCQAGSAGQMFENDTFF